MKTLSDARKVAKNFKATLVDDSSSSLHDCRIEAPKGMIWSCGDVHELVDSAYKPWKPDYKDLIERMNYGIEACTNKECEWCNNEQ